jgi:23S rRNA pseudouridine2605 synthase
MDSEEPVRPKVRLAKIIALRGLASRRGAEDLVREGRVAVNGVVVSEVATLVDPLTDKVRVDGQGLPPEPKKAYYVCYKPRGVLTSKDEEKNRPSVMIMIENLDIRGGIEPVGKLEFNAEGALLLTNDGDLAHKLTHPSAEVPRRYVAKCYRTPGPRALRALEKGVVTSDGNFLPAKARIIDQTDGENAWIEITVMQSGQQLVPRMLAALGHPVSKLRRESFATISIRGLERGAVRPLTAQEITRLRDIADGVKPKKAGKEWRGVGFAKPKAKANARTKPTRRPKTAEKPVPRKK